MRLLLWGGGETEEEKPIFAFFHLLSCGKWTDFPSYFSFFPPRSRENKFISVRTQRTPSYDRYLGFEVTFKTLKNPPLLLRSSHIHKNVSVFREVKSKTSCFGSCMKKGLLKRLFLLFFILIWENGVFSAPHLTSPL